MACGRKGTALKGVPDPDEGKGTHSLSGLGAKNWQTQLHPLFIPRLILVAHLAKSGWPLLP